MSQFFKSNQGVIPPGTAIVTETGNTGGPVPPDAAGNLNVIGTGNITVTGNPGTNTLTISETSSQLATSYTAIDFGDSPYTVVANDYYISADTSGGAITINFPNTTTNFRLFVVKDRTGNANTNPITITTPGGVVTIDGGTTYVFNQQYEAADILFNGTSYEIF